MFDLDTNVDPLSLLLFARILAFDLTYRPTAEEAFANPYFNGLATVQREPSKQPISKLEFEFERRRLTRDDVQEIICSIRRISRAVSPPKHPFAVVTHSLEGIGSPVI